MAIVVFRSKAAGDFVMLAENARRIFEIIGRPESPKGVITVEQVPDALQRLTAAVEQEKKVKSGADDPKSGDDLRARGGTLSQRAFPLIEMLRAAQKKNVDVTWGT